LRQRSCRCAVTRSVYNRMGEVLLDDLKIIPHCERSIQAAGGRD
jgi:hypothetical protein